MDAGTNQLKRATKAIARIAVLAIASLLAAVSHAGAIVPAPRIVELLNAQRSANGIPGDITERPDWSRGCAMHNLYMSETGTFGHDEDPGSPYYTSEGAVAGKNSVLAESKPTGFDWERGNPFESAPIHLAQLLTPRLFVMGADDDGVHICATTFPGYTRTPSSSPLIYTYPGDGRSFPTSEKAMELPWVPGDFVGLPRGTKTGPYMMAFLLGYSTSKVPVRNVKVTGVNGSVAVKVVDQTTAGTIDGQQVELGPYLPGPMAFIIPKRPLAQGVYHVHVVFDDGGTLIPHDWTFAASKRAHNALALSFQKGKVQGKRVLFELDAGESLVGATATITTTRPHARHHRTKRDIVLQPVQIIKTRRPPAGRRVRVTAEVDDPHVVATARYVGH